MRKKSKHGGRATSEELNSARRRSQAKCQLVQTSYVKRIKLLFLPYNKHLINRAKSVCIGESSVTSVVCTDLGQDSPIQTSCSVNKSLVILVSHKQRF